MSARGLQTLGSAAAASGHLEEALGWHERARDADPSFYPAYFAIGLDLIQLGRFREALPVLRQGQRLDPVSSVATGVLGVASLAVGRRDEAAAFLERSIAESSDLIPPRLVLAGIYASEGRQADAKNLVAEIRRINPELRADEAVVVIPPALRAEWIGHLRRAGLP